MATKDLSELLMGLAQHRGEPMARCRPGCTRELTGSQQGMAEQQADAAKARAVHAIAFASAAVQTAEDCRIIRSRSARRGRRAH